MGVTRFGTGIAHSALAMIPCAIFTGVVVAAPVPTTLNNYFLPGTQPDQSNGAEFTPILLSRQCSNCHELDAPDEVPIFTRWIASPKANSARDPIFHAALAVANQDAAFAGDLCLRCHTPGGWLAGRSVPTDGSALEPIDFDGVTCNFCHRAVDPVFKPGVSPAEDSPILQALVGAGLLPAQPGGGNYVVDPNDARRGPFFDVPANYHFPVPIIPSPFHTTSELCATCHDVSNPAMVLQPDGSYALNAVGQEHPTGNKHDMFPIERTYSEWLHSDYAKGGVDAGGVFGGNHPTGVMRTCQDCHMPDTEAYGCGFQEEPFFVRPDVPAHDFNGGNTWLQDLIVNLYPDVGNIPYFDGSKERARYMLEHAATMEVADENCAIRVRITNETGHKLPTGYPEGRRMWLTVQFLDETLSSVAERGAYDFVSAELTTPDTKVYEVQLGLDAGMAEVTGVAEGPSFHFVLNNKVYKDNRIPPRGFANASFASVQAAPVGAVYADGQYWDDTRFHIPAGATSAVVRVYYQTASKEYIEFLRDENVTDDAGDLLHEQWLVTGMSEPVQMKEIVVLGLDAGRYADSDCNGVVNLVDFRSTGPCVSGVGTRLSLGCESMDRDLDGEVDLFDFAAYQNAFTGSP